MGVLNPVLDATSLTMNMFQSRGEAASAGISDTLAADALAAQAARKELEADEALKLGELNQAEQIAKGRAGIAKQKTDYAYGGVKVNEGSALAVAADKAAWSEYERQKIEYESEMDSWGLRYDAALLRGEAANARASAGVKHSRSSSMLSAVNTGKQWIDLYTKS